MIRAKGTHWFPQNKGSGQIITTSAEVTLNGGLIRELPQNPLNSGLGIILICPELDSIGFLFDELFFCLETFFWFLNIDMEYVYL